MMGYDHPHTCGCFAALLAIARLREATVWSKAEARRIRDPEKMAAATKLRSGYLAHRRMYHPDMQSEGRYAAQIYTSRSAPLDISNDPRDSHF